MRDAINALWAMPADQFLNLLFIVVATLVAGVAGLYLLSWVWFRRRSRAMRKRHEEFKKQHGIRSWP